MNIAIAHCSEEAIVLYRPLFSGLIVPVVPIVLPIVLSVSIASTVFSLCPLFCPFSLARIIITNTGYGIEDQIETNRTKAIWKNNGHNENNETNGNNGQSENNEHSTKGGTARTMALRLRVRSATAAPLSSQSQTHLPRHPPLFSLCSPWQLRMDLALCEVVKRGIVTASFCALPSGKSYIS